MLKELHVLLTYKCTFECDHCFVYSSPNAEGVFTLAQVQQVMDEAGKLGTVDTFYFEGGEAFMYYPLLLESVRMARGRGFKVGIVTNAYFAASEEDAALWLAPLAELGILDLSISDDAFHYGEEIANAAKRAMKAAHKLGMPTGSITIEEPTVAVDETRDKGMPVVGGGVMFKGRAVEKLVTDDLPRRPWDEFTECPYEDFENPGRVHPDPYGHVHLCQGISMGNLWETPLSALARQYDPGAHPVAGPLMRGGPAQLAREYDVPHAAGYVDACHLCYTTRLALLDRFPEVLAPRQVYGLA
ncbi:MAG: radical SAM protein [Anaerolineae bacterium]|nr:radical SAM protein [Anaerolineae bacterium]